MFRTRDDATNVGYDSIRVPARNGVTFTQENNQLVMDLTRNVGFIDCSNSYLEAEVTIELAADSAKHCFNKNCGVQSAIRTLNLRSSGRLIEQLDHYNIYANLHYLASADEGVKTKRQRTELCAKDYQQVNNPWCARNSSATDGGAVSTDVAQPLTQKIAMPLLGGTFSTSKAFPLMAAPLEVELILAPAEHALHVVDGMNMVPCNDITNGTGAAVDKAKFIIKDSEAYGDNTQSAANQQNMCANAPWRVGQNIIVDGTVDGTAIGTIDTNIESLAIDGNKLVIKIPDADAYSLAAGKTLTNITVSAISQGQVLGTPPKYKIVNPRLVVSKVIPPPAQQQATVRMLSKGEYTYNITSYTDYQNAIDANVTNSTNIIPADLTRVKSILSVPVLMEGTGQTSNDYALAGRIEDAKNYQYQISNILRPDRRVPLERESFGAFPAPVAPFSLPEYAMGHRTAGLHLYEVEKALAAANIPVRNLKFLTNNVKEGRGSWLVGRSTGPYGLSENLSGVSTILYLNYNSTHAANILLHNFVSHIRTIQISMAGVEIFT